MTSEIYLRLYLTCVTIIISFYGSCPDTPTKPSYVCSPGNSIQVYNLPENCSTFAMQQVTTKNGTACKITQINSTSVKITGCSTSKGMPIVFTYGTFGDMELYKLHTGSSVVVTIYCDEIPQNGTIHKISNLLKANLPNNIERVIVPKYDVKAFLNATSVTLGNPVAWTISYPANYILEVTNCTAYPGIDDSSTTRINLISKGGCEVDEEFISSFTDNMDGTATAVINAFKFFDEDSVFFQCAIVVCPNSVPNACDTTCSRGKRSIIPQDAEGKYTYFSFNVKSALHVFDLPDTSGGMQASVLILHVQLTRIALTICILYWILPQLNSC